MGFSRGSEGKVSVCSAGDLGSILGSERSPVGGNGYPLSYSCLENSTRSLVGYSPWGRKESDTTERKRKEKVSSPVIFNIVAIELLN